MSIKPIFFESTKGTARQECPFLIFVEGKDDAYFLDKILEEIGASPKLVGVIIVEGNQCFSNAISLFKKSPSFRRAKRIAIIRDADSNPKLALKNTNDVFTKEFKQTVEHAKITTNESLQLAQFIIPNDTEIGDLEKLCLSTIAGSDLDTSVNAYLSNIQKNGKLNQINKRKVQVFLAGVPDDICRGAGLGFKKGFFDTSHKSLAPLKSFLADFIEDVPQ